MLFTLILLSIMWPFLLLPMAEQAGNGNACPSAGKLLTDMATGCHAIPAKSMDQCLLEPGQGKIMAYTLRFLKSLEYTCDGGHEGKGLLICYESMLAGTKEEHQGMVNALPFRIKMNPNNKVTQLCEEKRMNSPQNRGVPWNGILVRNEQIGGRQMLVLEVSLTEKPFSFPDLEQFDIVLMTDRKQTFLAAPNEWEEQHRMKHPNEEEEEKLYKYYMANVHKGIQMKKYKGLWMLGLDMLPHFDAEYELQLHVFRACDCPMQAFFLSPSEELPLIVDNKNTTVGSDICPSRTINLTTTMDTDEHGGKRTLLLHGITDDRQPIDVEILLLGKDDKELLNVTIQSSLVNLTDNDYSMAYRRNDSNSTLPWGMPFQLELNIGTFNYNLWINKNIHSLKFTPRKWWQAIPIGLIQAYKLKGTFLLLHNPQFIYKAAPSMEYSIPYIVHFGEMQVDGQITLKIIVHKNADFMQILLLHDAPDSDRNVGSTVLEIFVNFTANLMDLSSFKDTKIHADPKIDFYPDKNPFERGKAYEIGFQMSQEFIKITINGRMGIVYAHRMDIWNLNWFRLSGNVSLFEAPLINIPKIFTGTNFSVELASLLCPGDSIQFSGNLLENFQEFRIYFLHDSPTYNPIKYGGFMLYLLFHMIEGEKYELQVQYYNPKNPNEIVTKKKDIDKYDDFFMFIDITADQYQLSRRVLKGNYIKSIANITQSPPAWTVNHIQIMGQVKMDKSFPRVVKSPVQNNKIKQVTKLLSPGDRIRLQGTVNSTRAGAVHHRHDLEFKLSLFYHALAFHEKLGKTVLEIHLFSGHVTFRTYFSGQYANELKGIQIAELQVMRTIGQKLALEIEVYEMFYKITIVSEDFEFYYIYDHILPAFAAQYVVLEGDFDLEGQIEIVQNR